MGGPPAVLVTKASATHCRPWEDNPGHICALNRTHSDIVKFAPQSEEYDKVLARIRRIVQRALVIRLPNLSKSSQDCLQSLSFREMDTRLNDIDHALEGTCQWLLEHENYKAWTACSRGLLWVKGKPGSGKSTLLKYARKYVKETPKVGDRALVLSFYFHGRGAEIQKTPLGLFRSLLHQILCQVPDVLSNLVDTFDKRLKERGNSPDKWEWHPNELWDFFESSLPRILQTRSVWLFVDALDESGEENARDLFQRFKSILLKDLPSTCLPFRICLACRHYPVLDQDCQFVVNPERSNQKDISTYVQIGFSTSDKLRRSAIPDLITRRANGVFMWARLVVEQALKLHDQGKGLRTIEEKIKTLPPELSNLYNGLVKGMDEIPASLKLIQWICFATQPLSLDELRWAMIVDAECLYKSFRECQNAADYDCDMENRLKTLSRGLAEAVPSADSRVVQFVHQSVKDFFIDQGLAILTDSLRSTKPRATETDVTASAHHRLSRACLRYLAMGEIGQSTTDFWYTLESEFPLIGYATTSWTVHAKASEAGGIPQHDLIDYFNWPSESLIKLWIRIYQIKSIFRADNCPSEGMTLTHVVSWHGLFGPLQLLLDRGVEVGAKDSDDRTPLWMAVEEGHAAIVQLLLDRGAEVNMKDRLLGQTPLLMAAWGGHEAIVQLLLDRGAKVDAETYYNSWTPLWMAVKEGHEAIVQLLLDRGAEVNMKGGGEGWTPLGIAAWGGHEAIVQLLLDRGAEVDTKGGGEGWTPLWRAAKGGHEAIVQLLLDRGAEVDAKDRGGWTPLGMAAWGGHEVIMQLLLDRGAEVDAKDRGGRTPLLMAAKGGHEAIMQLLLDRGAEVDAKDRGGWTPLWMAVKGGHEAIVQLLLDRGAEVNMKDRGGWTPLWRAAKGGHEAIVQLLLDRGAEVDAKDRGGRTPLWRAVKGGHEAIVQLLLDRGAKVDAKDRGGRTPLWRAVKGGHEAIVQLLQHYTHTSGTAPAPIMRHNAAR